MAAPAAAAVRSMLSVCGGKRGGGGREQRGSRTRREKGRCHERKEKKRHKTGPFAQTHTSRSSRLPLCLLAPLPASQPSPEQLFSSPPPLRPAMRREKGRVRPRAGDVNRQPKNEDGNNNDNNNNNNNKIVPALPSSSGLTCCCMTSLQRRMSNKLTRELA